MVRPSRQRTKRLATCAAFVAVGASACWAGPSPRAEPTDGSVETSDALSDAGRVAADASDDNRHEDVGADAGIDATIPASEAGSITGCEGQATPPSTLACTGLYTDIVAKTLAPGVQFYLPAVILWSDNAQKMRWIQLPPGTQIDTSNPSEWTFPIGTKVWKQFSKNGKRVETRLFQKIDNGPPPYWVHTTYAWNADESAAVVSGGGDILLDDDGGTYHIPTFAECEKCHNGRTDHILGFEEVALGLDGAQGLTLSELAATGLLTAPPAQTHLTIGDDGTGLAAPALGWLHINCGVACHNGNPNASEYGLGMRLRLDPTLLDGRVPTVSNFDPLRTTIGITAASPGWIQPVDWTRIAPGDPTNSLLVQLISHRGTDNPAGAQMPPIASSIVDTADVVKVVNWVIALPVAPTTDGGADGGLEATVGAGPDAATDGGGD